MTNPVTRGNFGEAVVGISAQFFVSGKAVPQGSLKFINGHAIHVRAQDLALWRADIARVAKLSHIQKAEEGVEITLTFVVTRPKSVKRLEPHTRPDLDKLIRAVLDGLTGVAYEDDGQVTKVIAQKQYGTNEGVWIRLVDNKKLRDSQLASVKVSTEINAYSD